MEAVSSSLSDQRFRTPKLYTSTDSMVTIASLQDFPRKWNTFVANRVAKISKSFRSANAEENPADCASRGISAANLAKHSVWWNEPHWLKKSKDFLPKAESIEEYQPAVNNDVQRETLKQKTMVVTQENNSLFQLIHRIFSFGNRVFVMSRNSFRRLNNNARRPLSAEKIQHNPISNATHRRGTYH